MRVTPPDHSTLATKAARLHQLATHPGARGRRPQQAAVALSALAVNRVLHRPLTVRLGERSRIRADQRFHSSMTAAYFGVPDPGAYAFWRGLLRPGDLVVDVGANVGVISLLLAELGADVIAVEADRAAFAELEGNVRRNADLSSRVSTFCAAVSDAVGLLRFSTGRDASNAVVQGDEEGVEVLAVDLDTLLAGRRPRGLKVDVEGAERLVLEGASRVLAEDRPVLQLEWNRMSERCLGESREPAWEVLRAHDYAVCHVDGAGALTEAADPRTYVSDVVAVPSELVRREGGRVRVAA